jgi:hypothetical protein
MSILTERAMLVRHIVRRKEFRKFDRQVSEEVARAHGSDPDKSGRYNKVLIAREYLEKVNRISDRAYNHHIENTLPWEDRGSRILPAEHYFKYMEAQRAYRAKFEQAVAEFIAAYPEMIEEAKVRLNGMFNAKDYPPQHELAEAYEINVQVTPIPDAKDFRVDLSVSEKAKVKKQLEARMNEALKNAIADLWQRLHDSIETLRDRLAKYEESEKKMFFRAWVDNVRSIVELIPALNFTADPDLQNIAGRAEAELLKYEADYLREQDAARAEVATAADDILAAMAGYIGDQWRRTDPKGRVKVIELEEREPINRERMEAKGWRYEYLGTVEREVMYVSF